MTEHFTRAEAATLAKAAGFEVRRVLGLRESVPEVVFAHGLIDEEVTALCNAAVTAIDKKREAQGAPDGYVLVPVEPTPEMIRQGRITPCTADEMDADDDYRAVYKAMIAAAQPTEPAPGTDICQNCAGQGWEPSVYKGKVPCSFCQPAPSTAGELPFPEADLTGVQVCCGNYDRRGRPCTPRGRFLAERDHAALLQSTALPVGELTAWIATKHQYPPEGVRVFWLDENSNRVGYDTWAGGDYIWSPTHWMHIPATAAARLPQPVREPMIDGKELWLWQNGDHMLAFEHLYPCFAPGGDPMTLGKPFGKAVFRVSHDRSNGITKKGTV